MNDIPWNTVQSSNLAQWRYDPETQVLEIQFLDAKTGMVSDTTYSYDNVPQSVADGFKGAASVGVYFRNNIKDRYRFYKG